MKSVRKTILREIHRLEVELRVWSKEPNVNEEIINDITIELKEHADAFKILNGK